MQPTAHLKFIGGKLHQLWVSAFTACYGAKLHEEWRLVESE